MKIKEYTLSLFKKIEISLISILIIILTNIFFYILNFEQIINTTKKISKNVKNRKFLYLETHEIYKSFINIKDIFNINSCFKNCISLKIIFSYYGRDVSVIGGIRILEDKSIDGHAWLQHKEKILFESTEKIHEFERSFEI